MYSDPCRHRRPIPTDAHEGSRGDFVARFQAEAAYAWVKAGTLPHSRFGRPGNNRGTIRIEEEEFDEFLRTMRVTPRPTDDSELRWLT